jgi:RHH-type proline utilization regulon transcriptional repressor/proline dehydrogenase/delta 1-pyrroline-5-carboxylate dehydrogenase
MAKVNDLEPEIRAVGEDLLRRMDAAPTPALLSKKGLYGKLMEWSMTDPEFKTQLFRFVDVLPALEDPADLVRHLKEYLGDRASELSPALRAGIGMAGLAPGLVAGPVRTNVASMARFFVAGENAKDIVKHVRARASEGIATTVDLLGEMVLTEGEADAFLQRNLEALDALSEATRGQPPCAGNLAPDGPLPAVNLSVKISALAPELPPSDPEGALRRIEARLFPILRRAAALGAFINFDMESHRHKDLTLALFRSTFGRDEFRNAPACGLALQAYLRSCDDDLRSMITWGERARRPFTVRLVKGAYWDYENVHASQRGWPSPVWARKAESDLAFERLTCMLLDNPGLVRPAFATHNVRSCAHAIVQARRRGLPPAHLEFQLLFGMADELKHALLGLGYRVREYAPAGELLAGMAYFVRRLLENTSNEGFIRARNTGAASADRLLEPPAEALRRQPASAPTPKPSFTNCALADFTREETRATFRAALADVRRKLGRRHPLVINGKRIETGRWSPSTNPADPDEVIGHAAEAGAAEADAAVQAAQAAQPSWARTPVAQRCALLDRTAELMQARSPRLAALLVLEAGKPWAEADADVAEAIDFLRFYADRMRRLAQPRTTQRVAGEDCVQLWRPRGVCAVIAPWNFPLAILCGMAAAPLAGGNTVILKPAEQTPVIAAELMALFEEAGFPAGTVNLLMGDGAVVGARLVDHPGVETVAFTGSRAVGLTIWERVSRQAPGQRMLRRAICEMGGKNALIVDTGADLDEAISGILYSAFGYSGQKCSALSRLVVLDALHDELLARLTAAAASLLVLPAEHPGAQVVPVIDAPSRERLLGAIERARKEAKVVFQGATPAGKGHWVPPTIAADVRPDSFLAQEELFGPVLAVLRARNLDEAIALVNDSEYALTGGIYSRSPTSIARARAELDVGNLYINRPITGAIVERHPFGGFRMSGGGTKAGGEGYLEQFLLPRTIAENTLRRGFTPES